MGESDALVWSLKLRRTLASNAAAGVELFQQCGLPGHVLPKRRMRVAGDRYDCSGDHLRFGGLEFELGYRGKGPPARPGYRQAPACEAHELGGTQDQRGSGSMPCQAGTLTCRWPLVPLRITFRTEMSLLVLVSCRTWSGLAITWM